MAPRTERGLSAGVQAGVKQLPNRSLVDRNRLYKRSAATRGSVTGDASATGPLAEAHYPRSRDRRRPETGDRLLLRVGGRPSAQPRTAPAAQRSSSRVCQSRPAGASTGRERCEVDACDGVGHRTDRLVGPEAQHLPTGDSKHGIVASVPQHVGFELWFPIARVSFGH